MNSEDDEDSMKIDIRRSKSNRFAMLDDNLSATQRILVNTKTSSIDHVVCAKLLALRDIFPFSTAVIYAVEEEISVRESVLLGDVAAHISRSVIPGFVLCGFGDSELFIICHHDPQTGLLVSSEDIKEADTVGNMGSSSSVYQPSLSELKTILRLIVEEKACVHKYSDIRTEI
jgi:hypothetical protein